MVDKYTKGVLTVIAIALSVIAFRGPLASSSAFALGEGCGDGRYNPCYVKGEVEVTGNVGLDGSTIMLLQH